MATVLKTCKVCGKQYEYCHTLVPGAFRWQSVACCHEHALEYFRQVEAARLAESNPAPQEATEEAPVSDVNTEPTPKKRKKNAKASDEK